MSLPKAVGLGCLLLICACRLEDHTPAGSRRDEAQIRGVITEYYRSLADRDWVAARHFFIPQGMVSYPGDAADSSSGHPAMLVPADSLFQWLERAADAGRLPPPESRILRTDLRQANGYAAAWVTVQQNLPRQSGAPAMQEDVEHWVLQRTPDGWRIVLLTLPWLAP